MAATAEELANQAEMLQHTIAFFKTDETGKEVSEDWERMPKSGSFQSPASTHTMTKIAHINPLKEFKAMKESGDGKPARQIFNMNHPEKFEDEQ